jgi:ferric-dicitrate binding protein FerR (iron transport regulator)
MIQAEEKYTRLAARLLTEELSDIPSTQSEACGDTRRDAVVAAMALAIAEQARRRRIARGAVVVLALAASIAVVAGVASRGTTPGKGVGAGAALFVEHETGRGNLLVRAGATQPLLDLAALAAGDAVHSDGHGGATLAMGSGTRVTVAGSSHLRVDELGATRRFSLVAGQLDAQVAKLDQDERFIVSTPDAEVEVRGTAFTVAVEGASGRCRGSVANSSVKVSEGVVSVRSAGGQVFLHPGESWSAPCSNGAAGQTLEPAAVPGSAPPSPAASAIRPAARRSVVASPAAIPAARSSESSAASEVRPASHLAEQNDLFSGAMAAERQGQPDLALAKLEELLRRYPGGPLGESARAERARLLSAQGR